MKLPVITLKHNRERSLVNRHPWLFSGAVYHADEAPEGAIVAVKSSDGVTLAYGHYSPNSQIVCRMFEFDPENQPVSIDYWERKLEAAWNYRQKMLNFKQTNAFRLVNAEGDYMPGVVVDIYADVAVLQLRTAGAAYLAEPIKDFLVQKLKIKNILIKGEKETETSRWLSGEKKEVEFKENGLKYVADPVSGQKTGFFLDQRNNRFDLRHISKDRAVLNAFGYSGGFAVNALSGGAKSVTSVDYSKAACALCDRNIALNFPDETRHETIAADCFDYLRAMPENHFDLIVLDPPAFTKHISTVDKAARGYKDINLKALNRIKRGGLLMTYSCSQHISPDLFRKIIYGAAADSTRQVKIIRTLGHAEDHPVDIYHPEGEYLKGLLVYVS